LTEVPKLPKALEAIADIVLAHKPKAAKTKVAKKRRKKSSSSSKPHGKQ
jgi:hypothetical protein